MIYTYDSSMAGAPVLSGTAGALRGLLKACLVDGFGAGAVATLTVAGGVATATFAGAHPYKVGSPSQIAGSSVAGLNGVKRVLSIASDRITYDATGIADGAASGSITHKVAAAGWQELFAGQLANVIVLKPAVAEATGCVLRVDDTGATTGRVLGFESMTDIGTGAGRFPSAVQSSDGLHWPKSNSISASPRTWRCVASDRSVLIWLAPAFDTHGCLFGFGDLASYRSGDAYCCAIFGGFDASVASIGAPVGADLGFGHGSSAGSADAYMARASTALGGSVAVKKVAAHNLSMGYSGTPAYNGNSYIYPSPVDFGLRLAPAEVVTGNALRGRVGGVHHTAQVVGDAFSTGDVVIGEAAFAGRAVMALRVGAPGASLAAAGTVFVDMTGPWE